MELLCGAEKEVKIARDKVVKVFLLNLVYSHAFITLCRFQAVKVQHPYLPVLNHHRGLPT